MTEEIKRKRGRPPKKIPQLSQQERDVRVAELAAQSVPVKLDDLPADNLRQYTEVDPWEGLTDRQKVIQTMKIQGAKVRTIAQALSVSIPTVEKEIHRIKEIHAQNGASINAHEYVGEVGAKYKAVEHEAWVVVAKEKQKGNNAMVIQALQMVLTAQKAHEKLMMDIGLIHKKAEEVNHNVKGGIQHEHQHAHVHVHPQIASMTSEQRERMGRKFIESQLSDLEEPEPDPLLLEADYEEVSE